MFSFNYFLGDIIEIRDIKFLNWDYIVNKCRVSFGIGSCLMLEVVFYVIFYCKR